MVEPLMDNSLDLAEVWSERALLRVSAGDCVTRSCWPSVHLLRLRPHGDRTTSAWIVLSHSGRMNGHFEQSRGSATSRLRYLTASDR